MSQLIRFGEKDVNVDTLTNADISNAQLLCKLEHMIHNYTCTGGLFTCSPSMPEHIRFSPPIVNGSDSIFQMDKGV